MRFDLRLWRSSGDPDRARFDSGCRLIFDHVARRWGNYYVHTGATRTGSLPTNCQLSDHDREICAYGATRSNPPKENEERRRDKGLVKGGTEGESSVPLFHPSNREIKSDSIAFVESLQRKRLANWLERQRDAMAKRLLGK